MNYLTLNYIAINGAFPNFWCIVTIGLDAICKKIWRGKNHDRKLLDSVDGLLHCLVGDCRDWPQNARRDSGSHSCNYWSVFVNLVCGGVSLACWTRSRLGGASFRQSLPAKNLERRLNFPSLCLRNLRERDRGVYLIFNLVWFQKFSKFAGCAGAPCS